MFTFSNTFYPPPLKKKKKSHLIKAHNSLDTSKLLENKKKTGGCRELFLPENDFQTNTIVNFSKKPSKQEALGNYFCPKMISKQAL